LSIFEFDASLIYDIPQRGAGLFGIVDFKGGLRYRDSDIARVSNEISWKFAEVSDWYDKRNSLYLDQEFYSSNYLHTWS